MMRPTEGSFFYNVGKVASRKRVLSLAKKYGGLVEDIVTKGFCLIDLASLPPDRIIDEIEDALPDFCRVLKLEDVTFACLIVPPKRNFLPVYFVADPKFVKICASISDAGYELLKVLSLLYDYSFPGKARLQERIKTLLSEEMEVIHNCLECAIKGGDTDYRQAKKLATNYRRKVKRLLKSNLVHSLVNGDLLQRNI